MIDIANERAFIQEVDKKTRELELEKAKLEQNRTIVGEQLKQVSEKMASMGCGPENIDEMIQDKVNKITSLKAKMQSILEPQTKTEEAPF